MSASHLADVPADFRVMTSIRCDGNLQGLQANSELGSNAEMACMFYMLRYHRDRMLAAAAEFSWLQACHVLDGDNGLLYLEQTLLEHVNSHFGSTDPLQACISSPPKVFTCKKSI